MLISLTPIPSSKDGFGFDEPIPLTPSAPPQDTLGFETNGDNVVYFTEVSKKNVERKFNIFHHNSLCICFLNFVYLLLFIIFY
jgi:hypothetical protein